VTAVSDENIYAYAFTARDKRLSGRLGKDIEA
jgi:hypothetical protein